MKLQDDFNVKARLVVYSTLSYFQENTAHFSSRLSMYISCWIVVHNSYLWISGMKCTVLYSIVKSTSLTEQLGVSCTAVTGKRCSIPLLSTHTGFSTNIMEQHMNALHHLIWKRTIVLKELAVQNYRTLTALQTTSGGTKLCTIVQL